MSAKNHADKLHLIGITQRLHQSPFGETFEMLAATWGSFLTQSTLLPITLSKSIEPEAYFSQFALNGIILSGGNDIKTTAPDDDLSLQRDTFESELLSIALNKKVPVLGVCRGMQFLGQFFGASFGTVSGHAGTRHSLSPANNESRYFSANSIPDSVNSYHNYSITDTGNELRATAFADDGHIEAIEHTTLPIIGIMWHPEREQPFRDKDLCLFSSLFMRP